MTAVIGTIKETVEEIVIDGFFETAIQSAVRMVGGTNAAGHWISTLFTSLRESANFGYLTGSTGAQTQQGFAGQVQNAMELSTEFESLISEMMAENSELSVAQIATANEQFLTAQMAKLGVLEESRMNDKITLGRILATGIFTGLSLIAPCLAGFNLYAISKLLGGIGSRIDAKTQNKFLASRNSEMLDKNAAAVEMQKAELGKKPIITQPEVNLPKNILKVSKISEGANPSLERNPVEFATAGVSYFSAFGYKNGRPITHRQIIQEAINEEKKRIAQNQEKLEDLKSSKEENSKHILEQQKEAKQKIFENVEFGFDPYDSNLKYPLTDRDNLQSILFKTLLNLIYKNKKTIESVYRGDTRFDFTEDGTINYKTGKTDLILPDNLGAILELTGRTLRTDWLPKLDSQDQDFTFTRSHQLNIRKIRDSLNSIFDHIRLKEAKLVCSSLIENYIKLRYTGSNYFVMKLLTYIDDYTDFGVLAETTISEDKLKMSHGYLKVFRDKDVDYEHFSKYFNLIVNIYLSGESNLGFTDSDKFQQFKQKITQLTYMTLVESNLIKESHLGGLKFYSIYLTLIALSKLRHQNPANALRYSHNLNPRGYYTLTELSAKISPYKYEGLLRDQLHAGRPSFQLGNIFDELQVGIDKNVEECSIAKDVITRYLNIEQISTSRIGKIMHHLYEEVVIAYLRSKGVRVAHEKLVNYPHGFKPDNIIERSDAFIKKIEALQNILSIPDLIKLITVDYTFSLKHILDKLDKHYQSEDRMLIIVLLGQKNDRDIANFNDKLQEMIKKDDGSRHLKNVRIITSEDYKEFLGFDGNHEKIFDRYQKYSFNIFHSRNKLNEIIRESNHAADNLRNLKEDWIQTYLYQG